MRGRGGRVTLKVSSGEKLSTSLCLAENRIVNYEDTLHVDRNHTEQKDIIITTLHEPRGKSRYRAEGTTSIRLITSRKNGYNKQRIKGDIGSKVDKR